MEEATAIDVGAQGPVTAAGPVRLFRNRNRSRPRFEAQIAGDLLAATDRATRSLDAGEVVVGRRDRRAAREACAGKSALRRRYSDRCYVRVSDRIDAIRRTKYPIKSGCGKFTPCS